MMAQRGLATPTYAYALNNPVRYTDPDGRFVMFAIPAGIAVATAFGIGFGLGFGGSYLMPTTTTVVPPMDPQAGKRYWDPKKVQPINPGTACSSQPLTQQQETCKQQANNAATRKRMQTANEQEINLARAAEYCVCMGVTDSVACEAELKKIGWGSYL